MYCIRYKGRLHLRKLNTFTFFKQLGRFGHNLVVMNFITKGPGRALRRSVRAQLGSIFLLEETKYVIFYGYTILLEKYISSSWETSKRQFIVYNVAWYESTRVIILFVVKSHRDIIKSATCKRNAKSSGIYARRMFWAIIFVIFWYSIWWHSPMHELNMKYKLR